MGCEDRDVPTHLTFQQHLAGLHEATLMMSRHASAAGLDVAIPSCPEWTIRRLIGHQGRVPVSYTHLTLPTIYSV